MARQKSEDHTVVQGRGNTVVTHRVESDAGARVVPVNQEAEQLDLWPETAEKLARARTDGRAARPRGRATRYAAPKSRHKSGMAEPATIKAVTERLEQEQPENKNNPTGVEGKTFIRRIPLRQ
jgi:hypothetical protein